MLTPAELDEIRKENARDREDHPSDEFHWKDCEGYCPAGWLSDIDKLLAEVERFRATTFVCLSEIGRMDRAARGIESIVPCPIHGGGNTCGVCKKVLDAILSADVDLEFLDRIRRGEIEP